VTTTVEKPTATVLLCDPQAASSVPSDKDFDVYDKPRMTIARHSYHLFVLVTATSLEDVSAFVTLANRRNQLRALFVRSDIDVSWLPQIFDRAKLRTMRNTIIHSDFSVPARILSAWKIGAQSGLIANAQVVGDSLYVMSCEPQNYEIPFDAIPALKSLPLDERGTFSISPDGAYIHWPTSDVHLDLDSLVTAIDPERKNRADRLKHAYGRRYGAAIAAFRKAVGLKQSDVPDLSEREIRRIETGGEVSVSSLRKLATAHSMGLEDYLGELARRSQSSTKNLG
jgi:hypothetical protein